MIFKSHKSTSKYYTWLYIPRIRYEPWYINYNSFNVKSKNMAFKHNFLRNFDTVIRSVIDIKVIKQYSVCLLSVYSPKCLRHVRRQNYSATQFFRSSTQGPPRFVLVFLNLSVNNSIMGNLVNISNHFSAPRIMSSVFSLETLTFV